MFTSVQKNQPLCVIGESDQFLARLLQRFAEKSRMQVQFARTGEEILDLVQDRNPALIILEPELPGKTRGWEAARAIRANAHTADIAVIVCSWLEKDETLAFTGPVSAYLKKPDLHYEDFVEALLAAGLKSTGDSEETAKQ
jgi:CheY-like chemotaxis protein